MAAQLPPRQPAWAVVDQTSLTWRVWDDGLVLYDDRTDEIYRFDAVTAAVFEELSAKPQGQADLARAVAERLMVLPDSELLALVNDVLSILRQKNIVAPSR